MRTDRNLLALAATVLLATCGCHAMPKWSENDLDWLAEMAGKEPDAVEIVTLWSDASLKKAGTLGDTRGFGGRIYFYDAKQNAVKVQGDLTVYAFIEQDRTVPSKLPDRKFVFTAEELEKHYSRTALGHSYDIWLPWDKDLKQTVSVSLMPMLKTTEGKVVLGRQSLNVLKAKKGLEPEPGLEKIELGTSTLDKIEVGASKPTLDKVDVSGPVAKVSYEERTLVPANGLRRSLEERVDSASSRTELPLASGVDTMTVNLPGALGLAARANRAKPATGTGENPYAAVNLPTLEPNAPPNGTVFDLAKAAKPTQTAASKDAETPEERGTGDSARTGRHAKLWLSPERRLPMWKRQETPARSAGSQP